jgi:hypothetical protein
METSGFFRFSSQFRNSSFMSHDDAVAASGFHEYRLVRCHENRSERLNKATSNMNSFDSVQEIVVIYPKVICSPKYE